MVGGWAAVLGAERASGAGLAGFRRAGWAGCLRADAAKSAADPGRGQPLGASPLAVALAWLLQRSPNILLIPGTSSVPHLRENVAGAALELPTDVIAELDGIGRPGYAEARAAVVTTVA